MTRQRLAWSLAAVGFVAGLAHAWAYRDVTLDDAFIVFRYAHHFADGEGLVYNPGERVQGFTCLSWVLLVSAAAKAGLDLPAFAKALGLALNAATQVALFALARRLGFSSPFLAASAGLLLAANGAFAFESVAGLETPLFVFGTVLAAYAFVRETRGGGSAAGWSALCAGLALTRPDGLLFYPLFLLFRFVEARRRRDPFRPVLLASLATFAAIVVPAVVALTLYFGDPVPNTFHAKAPERPTSNVARGALQSLAFVDDNGGYFFLLLVALGLVARAGWASRALLVSIAATRFAFEVWSGGAIMGQDRFLVPALPFLLLLATKGLDGTVEASSRSAPRSRRLAATWAAAVVLAGAAFAIKVSWRKVRPDATRYMSWQRAAHYEIAALLRAHPDRSATILSGDAGAIPYVSGLRNVDWYGLTDRAVARLLRERPPGWQEAYVDHLLREEPAFVELPSERPDEYSWRHEVPRVLAEAPAFREAYEPAGVFAREGENVLWIWLYRRKPSAPTSRVSTRGD